MPNCIIYDLNSIVVNILFFHNLTLCKVGMCSLTNGTVVYNKINIIRVGWFHLS